MADVCEVRYQVGSSQLNVPYIYDSEAAETVVCITDDPM